MRLGKYSDLDVDDDVVGIQALLRLHAQGPKRHQLGVILDGDDPTDPPFTCSSVMWSGKKAGT